MEFLISRSPENNVTNLLLAPLAKEVIEEKKLNLLDILEQEPDAGLGNGGLGRLAARFMESAATMQLPAIGCGLRYGYGIFRQSIRNGWQQETPDNWLRSPDPWEVARPKEKVGVNLACSLMFSDYFSLNEPGVFVPLREMLLTPGDHYMHLADLKSYLEADEQLRTLYADPDE